VPEWCDGSPPVAQAARPRAYLGWRAKVRNVPKEEMARSHTRYGRPVYIDSSASSRGRDRPHQRRSRLPPQHSPSQASRLCTDMRAKKAVVFGPQRPSKPPKQMAQTRSASTHAFEDSEPLMFSFDEDLQREEKQRRYIAPIHHLCTRPAQCLR
jgi:hypothetical protein